MFVQKVFKGHLLILRMKIGATESGVNVTWDNMPSKGLFTLHCWLYVPLPCIGFNIKDEEAKLDGRK